MRPFMVLLVALAGCATTKTAELQREENALATYCMPFENEVPSDEYCHRGYLTAAAPKLADPCAPGQAHTPEQCPGLDDDLDGIANANDRCPLEAGIEETGGCAPRDADGDAIADHEDACPDVPGLEKYGGCPMTDRDGDLVADEEDRCPDDPGVPEEQGCPPRRAQIGEETKKIEITEKVFFDTGKATIQQRSHRLLDDVAALLSANTTVGPIRVEGHTDDKGSTAVNRQLSLNRAEAVKAYLVEKGVDPDRLVAAGFGEDRPVESNATAAGREANRRVEFVLVMPEEPATAEEAETETEE